MARQVRSPIATRSARLKLEARREPYWQQVEPRLSIGYYRPGGGGAGSWWCRTRLAGKYRQVALGTADDHEDAGPASAVLSWATAQAAGRAWAATIGESGPLTFGGAIELYLREQIGKHSRNPEMSLRISRGAMANIIGRPGGRGWPMKPPAPVASRLVAEITTAELSDLLQAEADRTSKSTANRRWNIIRAALNHAVRHGRAPARVSSACRAVSRFKGADRRRETVLDPKQVAHLIELCGHWPERELASVMTLLLLTGARPGELWRAPVGAFDAKSATLAVDGKTGPRRIALGRAAALIVARVAAGRTADAPLLIAPSGKAWDADSVKKPTARLIRGAIDAAHAAGRPELAPPKSTTGYTARHSWITNTLLAGASTLAVSKHCGTSLAMIETNYGHLIDEAAARTAALAESAILPADDKVVPLRRAGGAS